jgi:hypothetical protein
MFFCLSKYSKLYFLSLYSDIVRSYLLEENVFKTISHSLIKCFGDKKTLIYQKEQFI